MWVEPEEGGEGGGESPRVGWRWDPRRPPSRKADIRKADAEPGPPSSDRAEPSPGRPARTAL